MINYTTGEMHATESEDTLQLGSETDLQEDGAEQHTVGESDDDDSELTTEDQVEEGLRRVADVQVMMRPCDEEEERLVMQFAAAGCSCAKKCSFQFSSQYIRDMRNHCFDLSHNELDMVILGQLAASTNTSDGVVVSSCHHQKERERERTPHTTMPVGLFVPKHSVFCTLSASKGFEILPSTLSSMVSPPVCMETHSKQAKALTVLAVS